MSPDVMRRLGLILMGMLLACLGLEVGLRLSDAVPGVGSPLSSFHESDPYLGWSGKPDVRLRYRRPEQLKRRFAGEASDERAYRKAGAVGFRDLPGYAVTARLLGEMNRVAREHGARFFLVYVPQRSEFELDSPYPYVRAVHAMIDDITRREGIGLVDLSAPFRAQATAGHGLVFPIDAHWTPAGHRLAADVLLSSPIFY